MRILIDLQGAQTGSRFRGIGRSATALTRAIIRNRGDHEVLILLNGLFPDTIDPIRKEFAAILPADHIVVFAAPSPVSARVAENAWRVEAAELIREWVINALAPDAVLITSLFEGWIDPAVGSIRRLETTTKTAVLLHDLIPLLDAERYLGDPLERTWYFSKIDFLRRSDLLLAVSDSSRREAIDAIGFDPGRVTSIYSAADERFVNDSFSLDDSRAFLKSLGIRRRFVMHASKIEPRKNFEGLIRAFGLLPKPIRETHQLVLVGDYRPEIDKLTPLRRL
ncbi:MAG TPA: glycosyltransferase, partial [Stellaceae bacterium]|nr:glycosyltransferase [Stellaceae bacterium]